MRRCIVTIILTVTFYCSFADAGFSIERQKAASIIKFSGTANLLSHKLIRVRDVYIDTTDKRPYANKGEIIDDASELYIQDGGRRWEESDRDINLILVDTLTGKITDSLKLFAKDYSMNVKLAGDKDGKLTYTIDSTKTIYEYSLKGDAHTVAAFNRNRNIFICASIAGFVLLVALFVIKKKKANV